MIEKNINEDLVKREPGAKSLIQMIFDVDKESDLGAVALYHKFPLYLDENGDKSIKSDIIFVSQNFGIIVFKCIDYSERITINTKEVADDIEKIDTLLFSKILKSTKSIRQGTRGIKINITSTIFFHNCEQAPDHDEWDNFEKISTFIELKKLIANNKTIELSSEEYRDLKATIEGSKGIQRPLERKLKNKEDFKNSKGAILTAIENDIYNFDIDQKRAALFTIDGPQRIRGLAGSGKTVILAMKAALIHLQNPEAVILYTYYTKSLNDLIKRLITRFYRQFAEKDPNWSKIRIMHAWGGVGLEGVYYNACLYNNILPLRLPEAKAKRPNDPFDYACEELNKNSLREMFDYSILDEAQDFPVHFYRLCRQITKNDRVIWAFDDFQNILNVKIQDVKETFGKNSKGEYFIDFSKRKNDELQDLVLHICYRNPRKILLCAFALGLGVYNKDLKNDKIKMVQRLENNDHWESLGFNVEEGNSITGEKMVISRPSENSPRLKNKFLDDTEAIISIHIFDHFEKECGYIVEKILEDIEKELNPEDISLVCLDNRYAKTYYKVISGLLHKRGVKTFNLLEASSDNTYFKVPGHVTLSTIYKAKGNEAGSVYVLGIDAVFVNSESLTERNKVFTAMTRSLAWVTLTGVGAPAQKCLTELKQLEANDFKLIFIQPSEEEVVTIRQDIDQKQSALNKIQRLKDELLEEYDLSEKDLESLFAKKLNTKK